MSDRPVSVVLDLARFVTKFLLCAGCFLVHTAATCQDMWVKPGPSVPDVALHDHLGKTWRLAELTGNRPVVISFFFTGCTTICPPQTAALRALQEEITHRNSERAWRPEPVIISIALDALGDTPQAIAAYARRFGVKPGLDQGWLMLTGTTATLSPVWSNFEAVASSQVADHAPVLWIGRADQRRWTRVSALSAPSAVVGILDRLR